MVRTWIEDTWRSRDGSPTARDGQGTRWKAFWYEADPSSGRLTRRRSRRFRTKSEAERFLADVTDRQHRGSYISREGETLTLESAAREWLASAHHIKTSTRRRYERDLYNYVLLQWGGRTLSSITRRDIIAWVANLVDGTAPARYRPRKNGLPPPAQPGLMRAPLAASSIKHLVHIVSAIFRWAVDVEVLPTNPCTNIRVPRAREADQVYLTHAEVEALACSAFDVTGRPQDAALVYFLAYTGLRINEALALRVGDLDLARVRVHVARTWTVEADGTRVLGSPKSGKDRWVGVPPFVAEILRTITRELGPDDYVFQASRGGPIDDHNWRTRVFNLARDLSDVDPRITPHKLRHTAASMAIAAGADVKLVQHMLGHADATETLNTYSHLLPDRVNEIAAALDTARNSELGRTA